MSRRSTTLQTDDREAAEFLAEQVRIANQHWDGFAQAVLNIATNWDHGHQLGRLHPGLSAAEFITANIAVKDRRIVIPLLAESNLSHRQIAEVAGVGHATVSRAAKRLATVSNETVEGPATKTVGADGRARGPRRTKPAPESRLGHIPEENPDGMAGDMFWRYVRRIAHPEIDGRHVSLILADYRVLTSKARRSGDDPALVLADLKAARDLLSEAVAECVKEDGRSAPAARPTADDTVQWAVA